MTKRNGSQAPNGFEVRRLLQSEFGYYGTYGKTCHELVSDEIFAREGISPEEYIEQTQGHIAFGAIRPDNKLVGIAALDRRLNPKSKLFTGEAPYLHYLAVNRKLQHTQFHIGSALLALCEEFAVETGANRLRLRAVGGSAKFYEKNGYAIVSDPVLNRTAPYMEKVLGSSPFSP